MHGAACRAQRHRAPAAMLSRARRPDEAAIRKAERSRALAARCPGAAAIRRCARSRAARRGRAPVRWRAAALCVPLGPGAVHASGARRGAVPARPATRSPRRWWRDARPTASTAQSPRSRCRFARRNLQHAGTPAPNPRGAGASAVQQTAHAHAAGRRQVIGLSTTSSARGASRVRSGIGKALSAKKTHSS